jgi:O-glycosyl hydrolase
MAMAIVIAAALGVLNVNIASAQQASLYVSAQAGDRLSKKPSRRFLDAGDVPMGRTLFHIDPHIRYQRIDGFGASFLEAGAVTLSALPRSKQEGVLRSLFDPDRGAGFSVMKTVLGGNDFQSAEPSFYTYADRKGPKDDELKNFSIARDLKPNGLVPYILNARRYGTFRLQATMDYPPEWMLADDAIKGAAATWPRIATLNPAYYDLLAKYYLRYLRAYLRHGIEIEYLSPFNEPGVYTNVRPAQFAKFIRDHLGPLMARARIGTKIQIGDFSVKSGGSLDDSAGANGALRQIMGDAGARRYVRSISYHGYDFVDDPVKLANHDPAPRRELMPTRATGYDFAEFKKVAEWRAAYPGLPLWMTETCLFWAIPWAGKLPVTDFSDGDFFGQQIAAELENGTSAWVYWNMILDESGGPWLVDLKHNNPEHNAQQPLVVINRTTQAVSYTGIYYYLAHFSRFVPPGSVRIGVQGPSASSDVRVLAFERPDGHTVVEALNSGLVEASVHVEWRHKMLPIDLPARSISTLVW